MQLTPRQLLTQFSHLMQQELFPVFEQVVGPLSKELELLSSTLALVPLEQCLSALKASTGRRAKDRAQLATAFLAKAILNLPHTRHLISRLRVDGALRQFCGWNSVQAIPHESKFSRAFAQFAEIELPQRLHEAVILKTQKDRLIGHIARDSTAMTGKLYQVNTAYFCCGIVTAADRVMDAAPIMKWAIGRRLGYVIEWVRTKGGTVREVRA